jgi:hypothetical protein
MWVWLTQSIILAFLGGLALNVLKLVELQNVAKDRRPDFKDPLYWLAFAVWPIVGGFFGFLFDDDRAPLSKVVAFQIGMSAPLILRALANAVPGQIHKQLPPGA